VRVRNTSFGNNVRSLRRAAGLTQAQLAQSIRLHGRQPSRCYVTLIESGRIDPTLSTVRSIARALHVKPWQLVAELMENCTFWDDYLALSPSQKREIQRLIRLYRERR
jgi:transcriptional regulator with XRE-family HTH domain